MKDLTPKEIIELIDSVKPLPFFNQNDKDVFQLALDLVKALIEKEDIK